MSGAFVNRLVASLVAVVSIVVLVGCDGKDDAPSSGGPAKSSSGALTKGDFLDRMTSAISGAGSAHATISIASSEQSISGEGDLIFGATADTSAMDFAYDTGEGGFRLRVVDSLIYVNYGKATDNKFFKIDPKNDVSRFAKQFSVLLDQMDPATSYEPMRKAIVSVRKRSGSPRIGGVRTIPYEVVIDTDRMAGTPAMEGIPRDQLPDEFTYVFYMDKDDLARKISFRIEGTETVMKYSDFGKVPAIKPPAASEITTTEPFTSSI